MVLAVCLGSAPLLASMGPRKADSIQTGAPLKQHALFLQSLSIYDFGVRRLYYAWVSCFNLEFAYPESADLSLLSKFRKWEFTKLGHTFMAPVLASPLL